MNAIISKPQLTEEVWEDFHEKYILELSFCRTHMIFRAFERSMLRLSAQFFSNIFEHFFCSLALSESHCVSLFCSILSINMIKICFGGNMKHKKSLSAYVWDNKF